MKHNFLNFFLKEIRVHVQNMWEFQKAGYVKFGVSNAELREIVGFSVTEMEIT